MLILCPETPPEAEMEAPLCDFRSGVPEKRMEIAVREGEESGCTVENYYSYANVFMSLTRY